MAYNGHHVGYKHSLLDLAAALQLSWLMVAALLLGTAHSALLYQLITSLVEV